MDAFRRGEITPEELVKRATRTEFANGFQMHPTRPDTMQAVGTGPGPGGLHVGRDKPGGHSATVQAPLPKHHSGMIQNLHSHGNPRPGRANDYPSFTDSASAAHERSRYGVPTHGLLATDTQLDIRRGTVNTVDVPMLYNGQVTPSNPDGTLGKNDLPRYYLGVPNPDILVNPPSPGLTTISYARKQPGPGSEPKETAKYTP